MKLPYGYLADEDGKISINEVEADIIKMIFQRYLAGDSLGKIVAMLSERHITSPSGKDVWSRVSIDKLLSNKKYLHHIINPEQFFEVQFEKLKRSNVNYDTGNRKAVRYNSQNVLSGLLVCDECGSNYRRITPASSEVVWRCSNRVEHGKTICRNSPSIAESDIVSYLCRLLNTDKFEPQIVRDVVASISVSSNGFLTPNFIEQTMTMQISQCLV